MTFIFYSTWILSECFASHYELCHYKIFVIAETYFENLENYLLQNIIKQFWINLLVLALSNVYDNLLRSVAFHSAQNFYTYFNKLHIDNLMQRNIIYWSVNNLNVRNILCRATSQALAQFRIILVQPWFFPTIILQ